LNDDGLGELAPWLPFLARFYRPLEIDLAGAQISDAGLAALRGNKCLRYLNLGGTQVSDRGLVILKECPNIEYLCLAMNPRITDQGLATAGGLRSLRALDLTVTAVTDAGLVHLESLKELRYLRLWGTEVTDVGRSRMRESIPKLQIDD
jgi:hypothetical protein